MCLKKRNKKKSAVRKIYKTTDGYLAGRPKINKSRKIAVIEQRKDDGAVAVVKIYSKDGKENKIGKVYIPDLILSPDEHPSLKKPSVVGREVFFGVKEGDKYYAFFPKNFRDEDDMLTKREVRNIKKNAGGQTKKNKKTLKKQTKQWRKHFKNKKNPD